MPIKEQPKIITILLVEDSPTDALITQEALQQSGLQSTIHLVEDGIEALAFLRNQEPYQHTPQPDLILLDLNLPRKNGHEVLAEIKEDPRLKHIPVVVLTTSQAEEDILEAYNLHANCYIIKHVDLATFITTIQSIRTFWFGVVTLPSEVDSA